MKQKFAVNLIIVIVYCVMVIPNLTVEAAEKSDEKNTNDMETVSYVFDDVFHTETSNEKKDRGLLTTKYRVIVNKVIMRSGPGVNYPSLGTIYRDDVVWVRSISNGWAKFKVNSKWHYIPEKSIKKATY